MEKQVGAEEGEKYSEEIHRSEADERGGQEAFVRADEGKVGLQEEEGVDCSHEMLSIADRYYGGSRPTQESRIVWHMEKYEYSVEQLNNTDKLFSSALEDDGWVLYHATTSIAEDDIESNGLKANCSSRFDDQTLRVIRIFRAMNWDGVSDAGYSALRNFSLHRGAPNELYFREESTRSLIYSHGDFCGGETVRALHHALVDLQIYVDRPEIREQHYAYQVGPLQRYRTTRRLPNSRHTGRCRMAALSGGGTDSSIGSCLPHSGSLPIWPDLRSTVQTSRLAIP